MRKVLPVVFVCLVGIGVSNAAVRDASTISRPENAQTVTTGRLSRSNDVVSRASSQLVRERNKLQPTASTRTNTPRIASSGTSRTTKSRSGTTSISRINTGDIARAATSTTRATIDTTNSKTFGTGYNTCRDAYFTCMDQFCASADDTYRRCVCSSRLYEIKSKQRALSQSADQLQDFKDLNIEAIPKTKAEVQAMQNASEGELVSSIIKDKSASITKLNGISAVLSNTKSKSLSTAGKLDIAGDIDSIWATTNLTSGLNISNLTGDTLYSAVHSQCVNLVADRCSSKSLLNMIVSAYSMYIENDCSLISNSLNKQNISANASIRETEREMNSARLENYDAHNSSSINDCIAMVRSDITSDAACGSDYIHCLDVSGLYLNKLTGEPIYTSNFYQLGTTLSLSGDILTNQSNRTLVAELNRKRIFAENSLDTCRDLSAQVWDEFMRQAITEIYQGQQTRIRNVKNECLEVVNKCYDTQNNSLKDFSNVKEQLLLGARLELSEELCKEKLASCSNLYGGGPSGMQELLSTMYDITTQRISQNCFATLKEYAQQLCAVPARDSLHSYPYACRAYAPGDQRYASLWKCNQDTQNQNATAASSGTQSSGSGTTQTNTCSNVRYISCNPGYYMADQAGNPITTPITGNQCRVCPGGVCPKPQSSGSTSGEDDTTYRPCGPDYAGSLYQKLVRYAIQACMRPSDIDALQKATDGNTAQELWKKLGVNILQDVNATMDLLRVSLASSLKTECERLGGHWITTQWQTETSTELELWQQFYNETGANTKWGYCADPETVTRYYTGEIDDDDSESSEEPADDTSDSNGNTP